jgi:hypothetical protein
MTDKPDLITISFNNIDWTTIMMGLVDRVLRLRTISKKTDDEKLELEDCERIIKLILSRLTAQKENPQS